MKIRVERDGLADAVAWVARSLPSRPSIPVLGGVLIDAGGDGTAETTDALTVGPWSRAGCSRTSPSRCRPSRWRSPSTAPV